MDGLGEPASELLEVVEEQEQGSPSQPATERLDNALPLGRAQGNRERLSDGPERLLALRHPRELDESTLSDLAVATENLEGEPGLAHPRRPDDGHQPASGERLPQPAELLAPSDEAGERGRHRGQRHR